MLTCIIFIAPQSVVERSMVMEDDIPNEGDGAEPYL